MSSAVFDKGMFPKVQFCETTFNTNGFSKSWNGITCEVFNISFMLSKAVAIIGALYVKTQT